MSRFSIFMLCRNLGLDETFISLSFIHSFSLIHLSIINYLLAIFDLCKEIIFPSLVNISIFIPSFPTNIHSLFYSIKLSPSALTIYYYVMLGEGDTYGSQRMTL